MSDYPNSYFRIEDVHPQTFGGFEIPEGWWSRPYEYAWAIDYAINYKAFQFDSPHRRFVAADMGCGWHYRPFHDALATVCEFVYGVDHHREVLELPPMENGTFVVADLAEPICDIPEASLDRVFCISVLEELINYQDALSEFKRLLKPDGRIILTCDVPFDEARPAHELYKGVKLSELESAIQAVGLKYDGLINRVKEDLLHNDGFNLCVWHCVLMIAPRKKEGAE